MHELGGCISLVVSDRPGVGALDHGFSHGCDTRVIRPRDFPDRDAWDSALAEVLQSQAIDIIACAGFKRVLGPKTLAAFAWRIINIHPSLLPSFPGGLHAQAGALAHGVKVSGCSVHFVTNEVDAGPIIAQAVVPVEDDDTTETLAARILVEEHRIFPLALRLLAEGRLTMEGRRVRRTEPPAQAESMAITSTSDRALAPTLGA